LEKQLQKKLLFVALAMVLGSCAAAAQTTTNIAVLKGLAPLTILNRSYAGEAALASNYSVTGGIQVGSIRQSILLPFVDQQQQALKDAFITSGNLAQLSDGLGTTLGSAYLARAHYRDREHFTSISRAVTDLIAYTNATARDDSNSAKFFFANGTTDGKQAASDEALEILKRIGGSPDPSARTMVARQAAPAPMPTETRAPFRPSPRSSQLSAPIISTRPPTTAFITAGQS
jgi:hypothetical protein